MTIEIAPALRRVLVATDFSATAEAALQWGSALARPHGATVRLVHVLTLPTPVPGYVIADDGELGSELRLAAQERLDAAADSAAESGCPVETELQVGIPSKQIVEAAGEWRPDVLVIGTRGLAGLAHLLLGSTAERVVQHARCPVLSVHPDDADRHRPIETVLVPWDFSDDAQRALEAAIHVLPQDEPFRILLVHAYHLPVEYTAYGPIPTSVHYLRDVAGEAEERLREVAQELSGRGIEAEALCREGFAPDVIVRAATERGVDLIAMGTHGRSGLAHLLLGSTAERVVQKAPCPVMTLRREAAE